MSNFQRRYGRGVRRKQGEMNKLERAYSIYLSGLLESKAVQWFEFDAVKLRLAGNTFYTPDFIVMMADFTLEIHEVKGHWEDDARVKIKVAADKFPMKFKAIKRITGQWSVEEI